jgi:hypothetical protein
LFMPLDSLKNRQYIKDDVMFIKIIVDWNRSEFCRYEFPEKCNESWFQINIATIFRYLSLSIYMIAQYTRWSEINLEPMFSENEQTNKTLFPSHDSEGSRTRKHCFRVRFPEV